MSAVALGLPDLTKSFELFTYERLNLALGVRAQPLGSHRRAVAYFSKQLDQCCPRLARVPEGCGSHCHPDPESLKTHPWATHCSVCSSGTGTKPGALAVQ